MLTLREIVAALAGEVLPLVAFLTAAIWLAAFAERAGVCSGLAERLWRAARGRPVRIYGLACLLCAALAATVTLDGAVVLMVPVANALSPTLRRPLLLATIGVANAFSLALPQGNPTNLVVIGRLGISPADYVERLFLPALAATLLVAGAIAVVERRALRTPDRTDAPDGRLSTITRSGSRTGAARTAVLALLFAAVLGAAAPWLGFPPWLALCAVAAAAWAVVRKHAPPIRPPWRISLQIAGLVTAFAALPELVQAPSAPGPWLLVALALGAAVVASVFNNLPASIALAGLLGAQLPAYATLAGLSVGALATPRGSVATMIVLDRAGEGTAGYLRLWLPMALAATTLATLLIAATS